MIIECPKCGTKFRFNEKNIATEGIWTRCSRCQHVSYQEKPSPSDTGLQETGNIPEEKKTPAQAAPPSFEGEDRVEYEGNVARQPAEDIPEEFFEAAVKPPVKGRAWKNLWTPGKMAAYLFVLILVMGGVYVSIFPEVGKHLLGKTPLAQYFGIRVAADMGDGGGIDLLNVRERFIENRMAGSIMVIQGFAVNKNKYPVSKIKVRAKLLDASGEFIGESVAFCGDLLTEEELTNLTEREIRQELSNPNGKNVPNVNIPQDGNIPFMMVFFNSPPKATEYIVELAELEKPLR